MIDHEYLDQKLTEAEKRRIGAHVHTAPLSLVSGLTKRELFAGMAMQGLMAYPSANVSSTLGASLDNEAYIAVRMADALIKALE